MRSIRLASFQCNQNNFVKLSISLPLSDYSLIGCMDWFVQCQDNATELDSTGGLVLSSEAAL